MVNEELSKGLQVNKKPESNQPQSDSGITISPVYFPKGSQKNYPDAEGYPGQYPFTRGIYPEMYRKKIWSMRQYVGFGSAALTNERFHYLLKQGQTALSVAFDLPTQLGLDSDHEQADGEVGKVGVAVDTLHDMELLFKNIPLDKISTSMTINAPAIIIYCMYIAVADKQGVSPDKLTGTIQNDILKEYVARGTYIFPLQPSIRLLTDLITYSSIQTPKINPISISGYHIREAGANAIQELAFTFANAITYIDEMKKQDISIDHIAPRLSFFFSASSDFFEEIAKFRAARRIWANIMKEWYQTPNPNSWKLRFHTQTAGSSLMASEIDNNIVRVTLQALSAILGGTQSLHTNAKDEAHCIPDSETAKLALRTQQIIADETGITNTVDPLGGSYYVESLTNEIEAKVYDYLNKIIKLGGAKQAIETGYFQEELEASAYKQHLKRETGKIKVHGESFEINKSSFFHSHSTNQVEQILGLHAVKKRRNELKARACLGQLESALTTNQNLVPYVLNAVKSYCTIGEICDVLRSGFGEYTEEEGRSETDKNINC